jgi:hypothetical protein
MYTHQGVFGQLLQGERVALGRGLSVFVMWRVIISVWRVILLDQYIFGVFFCYSIYLEGYISIFGESCIAYIRIELINHLERMPLLLG